MVFPDFLAVIVRVCLLKALPTFLLTWIVVALTLSFRGQKKLDYKTARIRSSLRYSTLLCFLYLLFYLAPYLTTFIIENKAVESQVLFISEILLIPLLIKLFSDIWIFRLSRILKMGSIFGAIAFSWFLILLEMSRGPYSTVYSGIALFLVFYASFRSPFFLWVLRTNTKSAFALRKTRGLSMFPEAEPFGSIAVALKNDSYSPRVGDIVEFVPRFSMQLIHPLVVHRIEKIENGRVVTKGDSNEVSDQTILTGNINGPLIATFTEDHKIDKMYTKDKTLMNILFNYENAKERNVTFSRNYRRSAFLQNMSLLCLSAASSIVVLIIFL